MTEALTLRSLVGTHVVDGVGEYLAARSYEARVFLLRVDDRVLAFQEDPMDGYRSMLGEVRVVDDGHADLRRVVPFSPRTCHFAMRVQREDDDDVLVVTDDQTGIVLLEIGTQNSDDYYPNFISHWTPSSVPCMVTGRVESES